MNHVRKRSGTTLFLIELMICVGVFAFCAAVCLGIFAWARQMTRKSTDLSAAALAVQSAAECYKAAKGDPTVCAALLGADIGPNGLTLYFDETWMPTDAPGTFAVTVTPTDARHARIAAAAAGEAEPIFAVTASHFGEEVWP